MLESLKRIFSIEELKGKIIFTLFLLIACRIGAYVSVPGINSEAAVSLFKQATGGGQNLFQLMDVFSGGAFAQMTIIALGVMPYISASIIMQLFMALIPSLQREVRENPEMGRRKLSKWIRILTLVLALLQAGLFGKYALQWNASSPGVIAS
ncbi:MAG TPA: preprotein translocase subunit SecY, partial [Parachlamydiales bacterium]|nr:preprotein translocase subunit SecY [Parachlamydiales bacterium]